MSRARGEARSDTAFEASRSSPSCCAVSTTLCGGHRASERTFANDVRRSCVARELLYVIGHEPFERNRVACHSHRPLGRSPRRVRAYVYCSQQRVRRGHVQCVALRWRCRRLHGNRQFQRLLRPQRGWARGLSLLRACMRNVPRMREGVLHERGLRRERVLSDSPRQKGVQARSVGQRVLRSGCDRRQQPAAMRDGSWRLPHLSLVALVRYGSASRGCRCGFIRLRRSEQPVHVPVRDQRRQGQLPVRGPLPLASPRCRLLR
jgi:hypothetical protein